jgi:hypothetical protein
MKYTRLSAAVFLSSLALTGCSTNHPGVSAGMVAGNIFGSAVRVDGRHTLQAIYLCELLGAGLGYTVESISQMFSPEDPYGRSYVVRVPILHE